jgi:hypothetical protein
MKRPLLAVFASLLFAGLVPGSALANIPNTLDQSQDVGANWGAPNMTAAQTFTAGKTGTLTDVWMGMGAGNGGNSVTDNLTMYIESVDGAGLPTGTQLATASASITGSDYSVRQWIDFSFSAPYRVVTGTKYAIVITTGAHSYIFHDNGANSYSGGAALRLSAGNWIDLNISPSDLVFRTYVDTATTQLQWDKPQITAGVAGGTPLTLTATMTFNNGGEADHYGPMLGLVPTWFTPTGVTCSDTASRINPTDCTLANFGTGFGSLIPASDIGDVMTFVVTGTANPSLTDAGTSGLAGGNACIHYPQLQANVPDPECGDGTATVQVVAPAATPAPVTPAPTIVVQAATAPPTSTGGSPSSDSNGSAMWVLPLGLIALFASLLAIAFRRRRIA